MATCSPPSMTLRAGSASAAARHHGRDCARRVVVPRSGRGMAPRSNKGYEIRSINLPRVREQPEMLKLAKKLVIGTPLEAPARRLAALVNPPAPDVDAMTFEVMRRTLMPDSNAIDIGCHEGLFLRRMLEWAPLGYHLAFEPLPFLFQRLEEEFGADHRVQLFHCALSDLTGRVQFHYNVDHPAYSGLRRRLYPSEHDRVELIDVEV